MLKNISKKKDSWEIEANPPSLLESSFQLLSTRT